MGMGNGNGKCVGHAPHNLYILQPSERANLI